jgi:hypothetical protein
MKRRARRLPQCHPWRVAFVTAVAGAPPPEMPNRSDHQPHVAFKVVRHLHDATLVDVRKCYSPVAHLDAFLAEAARLSYRCRYHLFLRISPMDAEPFH